MKILRIFGSIGLVIFTILFMMACGRGPESDSTSNEYLKAISTISSSVINALKGTKIPILNHIKSPSLQENNLISFGFRSSKAGTISYSGNCFGSTKNAIEGRPPHSTGGNGGGNTMTTVPYRSLTQKAMHE